MFLILHFWNICIYDSTRSDHSFMVISKVVSASVSEWVSDRRFAVPIFQLIWLDLTWDLMESIFWEECNILISRKVHEGRVWEVWFIIPNVLNFRFRSQVAKKKYCPKSPKSPKSKKKFFLANSLQNRKLRTFAIMNHTPQIPPSWTFCHISILLISPSPSRPNASVVVHI